MVASRLELAGPDWPVLDFSSPCRRQKTLPAPPHPPRPGTGALHLLIDSTGVKAEGDGEWLARKHGQCKPRAWRKVHLGIDAETLEIRAIETTGNRIGDAPVLADLLDQIPGDQPLGMVTADGACGTRARHAAIAARRQSSRPAGTPSRGRNRPQAPPPATRRREVAAVRARPSGSAGLATTDEVRSRRRCAASSSWVNASSLETTANWPSFGSGQPSSSASLPTGAHSRSAQGRSARGKGNSSQNPVCATMPPKGGGLQQRHTCCKTGGWLAALQHEILPVGAPIRRPHPAGSPEAFATISISNKG